MTSQKLYPYVSTLPVFLRTYSIKITQFICVMYEILHLKFTYQVIMYKSCTIVTYSCIDHLANGAFLLIHLPLYSLNLLNQTL